MPAPDGDDRPGRRRGASPATDAAAALLGRLVELGIRHVVLSPGSRSQAPALVAADLERLGSLRLLVRIDERVAGFTALGIGRESGMPAAVICTSGTAVANLLPAALEAHHAGVPLVLLTADRPPELRGVGANQTTRQPGMFSPNMRFEADLPVPDELDDDGAGETSLMLRATAEKAVAAALGAGTRSPGPVHLNLPFREPLAGATPPWLGVPSTEPDSADAHLDAAPAGEPHVLEGGPRTVVIAGADAGPDAEALAFAGGWPLIAEIVSGARFGRNLVHGYRTLLSDAELGGRIQRAIVLGHPTLSREVVGVLADPAVDVLAVRGPGEPLNLNGATVAVDRVAVPTGTPDTRWLGAWQRASRAASVDLAPPAPDVEGLSSAVATERLGAVATELDVLRAPLDRAGLVDAVWRASWPHDRLVFGSSRLVRVADAVLGGKKVPVHANRGLAGIDGTVSTAIGIALASQAGGAPGVTRVILGDLALLHDVGALLLAPGEDELRIQVIVGNDGGGTIFDDLEVAGVASPESMRRVLYTPHAARLEHLALAYGWEYHRVTTRSALDQVLTAVGGGRRLIEVPLPR